MLIYKGKIQVKIFGSPVKDLLLGICFGVIWIGASVAVLYLSGILRFAGKNDVQSLPIWLIAALLNVIMQEYLMRGYLFQFLAQKVNSITAIIISTLLFTVMHGGAFEAGVIAVLNVITMSVFISLLLLYTGNLLAPILAHFIWNSVGGILLGGVLLADDYPKVLNCTFSGSTLLTSGSAKIEGSVIVLIVNCLLILAVHFMIRKHSKKRISWKK